MVERYISVQVMGFCGGQFGPVSLSFNVRMSQGNSRVCTSAFFVFIFFFFMRVRNASAFSCDPQGSPLPAHQRWPVEAQRSVVLLGNKNLQVSQHHGCSLACMTL